MITKIYFVKMRKTVKRFFKLTISLLNSSVYKTLKMKVKIIVLILGVFIINSCSINEGNCKCNEYLKSTNGNLTLYGVASMGFCDGTLPNPTPKIVVYKKECN